MQPHVKRMKQECDELFERTTKLHQFIELNLEFHNIDEAEQQRMKQQLGYMTQYLEVLQHRIIAAS